MHQGMMQPSFAFANPANGGWWMTDRLLICLTDSGIPLVLIFVIVPCIVPDMDLALCRHGTWHCARHGIGIVSVIVLGIVSIN